MEIFVDDLPSTGDYRIKDESELTELFVDEDKKRTSITPKCQLFLTELIQYFGNDLFSYQEAKKYGEAYGYSEYAVTQWLNMLWKFGKLKKFCISIWYGHKKGTTSGGKYWGVHYKLI